MVERISRIYYDGKYYMYPVAIGDVIRNAGVGHDRARRVVAFLWAAPCVTRCSTSRSENMKDAYTAQFGSTLYEMFFRRYTREGLGQAVRGVVGRLGLAAEQGALDLDVAHEALSNRKSKVEEPDRASSCIRATATCASPSGWRRTSSARASAYSWMPRSRASSCTAPHDIEVGLCDARRASSERFAADRRRLDDPAEPARADASTPKAERRVIAGRPQPRIPRPDHASTSSCAASRYRATRGSTCQDEDILFGRLHEPKNWSPAMVPDDDHTSLVLECFCTVGDAIWSLSDDDVARALRRRPARQAQLHRAREVEGWNVVRTRFAYPVYDLEYAGKLAHRSRSSSASSTACTSSAAAARSATTTPTTRSRWGCCWAARSSASRSTTWTSTRSRSTTRSRDPTRSSATTTSCRRPASDRASRSRSTERGPAVARAVVTFHSIDDSGSVLSFAPRAFEQLIERLASSGTPVVTFDELLLHSDMASRSRSTTACAACTSTRCRCCASMGSRRIFS